MPEITFSDENFNELISSSENLTIVDFWAPWCGPCKIQGPIIEELADDYHGQKINIGKLNVDENPQTAANMQIMSIPTIIIFKNGKPIQQFVGVQSKDDIVKAINKYS